MLFGLISWFWTALAVFFPFLSLDTWKPSTVSSTPLPITQLPGFTNSAILALNVIHADDFKINIPVGRGQEVLPGTDSGLIVFEKSVSDCYNVYPDGRFKGCPYSYSLSHVSAVPSPEEWQKTTLKSEPTVPPVKLMTWGLYRSSSSHIKEIYVCFGGSITEDWIEDTSFVPSKLSPYIYLNGAFKNLIENEFDDILDAIETEINQISADNETVYTIYPTGHSIGGGLAQTFSVIYKQRSEGSQWQHKLADEIYTFASPLILYSFGYDPSTIAANFNERKDSLFDVSIVNVVNELDIVPRMPAILEDDSLQQYYSMLRTSKSQQVSGSNMLVARLSNTLIKIVKELIFYKSAENSSKGMKASLMNRFTAFDKTLHLPEQDSPETEALLFDRGRFDARFSRAQYGEFNPAFINDYHAPSVYWKKLFKNTNSKWAPRQLNARPKSLYEDIFIKLRKVLKI